MEFRKVLISFRLNGLSSLCCDNGKWDTEKSPPKGNYQGYWAKQTHHSMEFTQRDTENKTQVFLKNHSLSWFIHGSQLTIYIAYQGYRAKNSPVNGIHPKRYKE